MVAEKLASPRTLFKDGGEARLGFITMLGGGVGVGDIAHLGLEREPGGEGMELGGCGVGSTMGREEPFEGRGFGESRGSFSPILPSYFCNNS